MRFRKYIELKIYEGIGFWCDHKIFLSRWYRSSSALGRWSRDCDIIYVTLAAVAREPYEESRINFRLFWFFFAHPELRFSVWLSVAILLWHLQAIWKPSHLHAFPLESCLRMDARVHFVIFEESNKTNSGEGASSNRILNPFKIVIPERC